MDTGEINRLMRGYKNYVGAFPCDRAVNLARGSGIILNTDPVALPGEHWVAIYRPLRGKTEYFDSFGLPPLVPEIIAFLASNSPCGLAWSRNILQHDRSDSCGHHCINYLKHRLLGISPSLIMTHFSKNRLTNDRIVKSAVRPKNKRRL